MTVTVQRATPKQAARLTQIAHTAKSYWGYPSHWIELWRNQLTITPDFVQNNEVYAAIDADGVVLGFYALGGAGETRTLEHLWVQPSSFGAGVGRLLFEHAMARARELGAHAVEIESDPHAEGFQAVSLTLPGPPDGLAHGDTVLAFVGVDPAGPFLLRDVLVEPLAPPAAS